MTRKRIAVLFVSGLCLAYIPAGAADSACKSSTYAEKYKDKRYEGYRVRDKANRCERGDTATRQPDREGYRPLRTPADKPQNTLETPPAATPVLPHTYYPVPGNQLYGSPQICTPPAYDPRLYDSRPATPFPWDPGSGFGTGGFPFFMPFF